MPVEELVLWRPRAAHVVLAREREQHDNGEAFEWISRAELKMECGCESLRRATIH